MIVGRRTVVRAAVLTAAVACGVAQAQTTDPLTLVPQADAGEPTGDAIALRAELARDQFDRRFASGSIPSWQNRVALDFRHEWSLGGWKLGLSDRLEQVGASDGDETRNALREAYASKAIGSAGFLDAGRINWRNGVGIGFNPTDFLKRGALVAQTTQNPQALRENRLGTVMLRAQAVSMLGSAQLALIPDLADTASTSATAPAWDRTNSARAALLKFAPNTGGRTSLDVLGYARAGERPRLGMNASRLIGDAWVAHAEWVGAVARPLAGPGEAPRDERWTNALTAGVTWTTPAGIVLALERQYSGDALTPDRWSNWQAVLSSPRAAQFGTQYGAMRSMRASDQAPLTRDAWFARAAWDDAFGVRGIDLVAITRVNADDHSRLWQGEAHWHVSDRHSVQVIVGGYAGGPTSEYGSAAIRRYAQVGWLVYF